jgi:hypothetical protein
LQATQASPQAKACKRVCLSNRTDTATQRTDKPRPKEGQLVTAVWRNGGCSASYVSFVVGSSAVLRLNISAKNPPLRQAANR